MSSIFKKLSVILCCLFGLISINPATWAKPGDYLVYFFGKDYKPCSFPTCGKCKKGLDVRAGQFCCPSHCEICSIDNIRASDSACRCNRTNPGASLRLMRQYGPFCFIKYENGGDFDAVFKDAKNSGELYCAYCMAKELMSKRLMLKELILKKLMLKEINVNFYSQIFVNVPRTTYSVPPQFKGGLGFEFEILFDKVFKLDDIEDNLECPKCQIWWYRLGV